MRKFRAFLLYTIVTLAVACQDKPEIADLVKDMVVQTNFDTSVDFHSFSTYTLSLDTIGYVSNTSDRSAIVNAYAQSVTAQVKKNLDEAGFQSVPINQNPDLGVNVFVVDDLSISQSVYYPNYYYGYPGYPGSYYGGYYGYYGYYNYPYISTTYFRQALLIIELVDLHTIQNQNARVVWTASMGDIITTVDQNKKIQEAIDQAFIQSPYLKVQ